MARYLVIVESPAKVKTIKKFLGSSYVVTASNGHVRDLPKSTLGIDVEHDFEPKYITIRGKGEGSYRIDNLEPIESNIDSKTEKLVLEWAIKHRDILVSTWNEFHGYRITVS